ncbi:MAG TPA: sulfur carrier protein ThiS [Candidatus Limnocylindrales bacterium]|nr:sulfur carrier protein ThiS [Candidatus Limnocylindrales bacterium]
MKVIINGEEREVPSDITILQLLQYLQVDKRVVAVEHNLQIVPKSAYEHQTLKEGDKLELVQFVGGG